MTRPSWPRSSWDAAAVLAWSGGIQKFAVCLRYSGGMVSYAALASLPPADLLVGVRLGLVPVINKHLRTDPAILDRPFLIGLGRTETCVELAARTHQFAMVSWMRTRGAAQSPKAAPTLLSHAVAAHHGDLVALLLSEGWDFLAPASIGGPPGAFETALSMHWTSVLAPWVQAHPEALSSWRGETGQTLGHRAAVATVGSGTALDSPALLSDMNRLWRMGVPWDDVPDTSGRLPSELLPQNSSGLKLIAAWDRERARRDRIVLKEIVVAPSRPPVTRRRM